MTTEDGTAALPPFIRQEVRAESGYAYGVIGADIHVFGDGLPVYRLENWRATPATDSEWLRELPSRMLNAGFAVVPFTGRVDELTQLHRWRQTGPRLAVRWFVNDVTGGTRSRRDLTHLYLMLEEGGRIGVQWETPGGDHLQRYRMTETDGDGCPHCAILAAVEALKVELPLDNLRAARIRDQYLFLLGLGKLPCPAFATEPYPDAEFSGILPVRPSLGWLADCHAADGNPRTAADCAAHHG